MESTKLTITDEELGKKKTEFFWNKKLRVVSHSGLNFVESEVLERLPELVAGKSANVLIAGNRTGVTALALRTLNPEATATIHAFDIHHAKTIAAYLAKNGTKAKFLSDDFCRAYESPSSDPASPLRVACTASIPQGPYTAAVLMHTPGLATGELLLDQLEEIHEALADGGTLILSAEVPREPLFKQVRAIFGNMEVVTLGTRRTPLVLLTAQRKRPLPQKRDFSAKFAASLPGHVPIELVSLPGVFCHRRPDTGGLALSEIASQMASGDILDMGCGCGLVGVLLAAFSPVSHIAFVDSHARALEAARRNAASIGLTKASFILSDTGAPQRGYDLFAGNPPYYSEYRIADVFLETAHRSLKRGGICLTVAKRATALSARQKELFGNIEEIGRRGYAVLKSIRKDLA